MDTHTISCDISTSGGVKVGLADWLTTALFWAAFAGVLVVFDVVQRVAILISRRMHEKTIVLLNRCLVWSLRLAGTKVQVKNQTELPADRPVVVVSNHQAMFDIPILHCVFAERFPRFISKIELSKGIPSVSYNLRHGGNAVIDRGNPRQSVLEIKRLAARMSEQRFVTVIFPEGTRAKDGELKRFRTAGLATLFQSVPDAVVVPVAIDGSWKLASFGAFPVPQKIKVSVVVGDPIEVKDLSADEIAEVTHAWVTGKLQEMRSN